MDRRCPHFQELNNAWQRLKQMALMRQDRLYGAHEIQRFNRDADETVAWIAEKDVVLSSDDYGRDLASVQALQRKHEGIERDLAALEDKVSTLGREAERLCGIHADHEPQIRGKRDEIEDYWQSLTARAKGRKERLDESYALHRFLADFRDLVSWINDMKAIISADELAKDVAGAEALLERHQEHKGEIDAREDSFAATIEAGQLLLERRHFASDEVKEKLSTLQSDKNSLLCKCAVIDSLALSSFYFRSLSAVGGASYPLRAVHGSPAVLQRHGTGRHLDGETGSVSGERGPGRLAGFGRGLDQETRRFREEPGRPGRKNQGPG